MQELVDYITAGNIGLMFHDWLVLELNSNSIYPYGIRNHLQDTSMFYSDIEECMNAAKKYFASLDKPVEPEQPTEEPICQRCESAQSQAEHFKRLHQEECLRYNQRFLVEDAKIYKLENKLKIACDKLEDSRGMESEYIEYNHQLLADQKRLYKRIHEAESKVKMYDEHYPRIQAEKEELRTFIFDTLKLETLFHKLRVRKKL